MKFRESIETSSEKNSKNVLVVFEEYPNASSCGVL